MRFLPAANVKARNTETGLERSTMTSDTDDYEFESEYVGGSVGRRRQDFHDFDAGTDRASSAEAVFLECAAV